MTAAMTSGTVQTADAVSDADSSFNAHERLALAMLAVEAGDAADVEAAMRKLIRSAPDEIDIAFVLSLAMAIAGDRALRAGAPRVEPQARAIRA